MTDPWATRPSYDDAPTTPNPTPDTSYDPFPAPEPASNPAARPPTQAAPTYWAPPAPPAEATAWNEPPAGAPVQPVTPPRKRGGAMRWVVALLATAVLIVAGVGVAVFAAGARNTTSLGPTFLPASTVLYAEARLDLPGDQRDSVVKFLAHFPGFADPSSFDTKIDDVVDNWLGNATSGKVTYTRDVKPWFGGQVALGLTAIPDMTGKLMSGMMPGASGSGAGSGAAATDMTQVPAIGGLSVKDAAKLRSTLDGFRSSTTDATFSDASYDGATIVTVTKDGTAKLSYAVTDKLLLFAPDAAGVETALDVLGGKDPSLANSATFTKAFDKLPPARLGALYLDGVQLRQAYKQMLNDSNAQSGAMGLMDTGALLDAFPDQLAAALTAQPDHVGVGIQLTNGPKTPVVASRQTDLAASFPRDTMVYVEARDFGKTVHDLLTGVKSQFGQMLGSGLDQVETALGTKLEDYLDFVQDVGIGGSYDGKKLSIGLAATVTDEAVAKDRVGRLVTTIRLAAATGAVPIKVSESTVDGVTVTTFSAGEGLNLPADLPIDVSVSVAVGNGKLYLGTGDFAAQALGRTQADSLAGNDRYTSALAAAGGSPNSNVIYADIAGIRDAVIAMLPKNDDFQANTLPYIEPLDRLIEVGTSSDGSLSAQLLLYVH